MTYITRVSLECSYGLYQPWELQEATIEHQEPLTYSELYTRAIKAIAGSYVTYGAMVISFHSVTIPTNEEPPINWVCCGSPVFDHGYVCCGNYEPE